MKLKRTEFDVIIKPTSPSTGGFGLCKTVKGVKNLGVPQNGKFIPGNNSGAILTPQQGALLQKELGVGIESIDESELRKKINDLSSLLDQDRNSQKIAGYSAGNQSRLLPEAIAKVLSTQIDWKHVLASFIGKIVSADSEYRNYKRRHITNETYINNKSRIKNKLSTCVLAVDTSGSMSQRELATVLNEIKGIAELKKFKKFEIVWFDAKVYTPTDKFTNNELITKIPVPKGGGGTLFIPPLEYLEKIKKESKMDVCIFVTDGYCYEDLKSLPVPSFKDKFIWVLLNNNTFKQPFSNRRLHINSQ